MIKKDTLYKDLYTFDWWTDTAFYKYPYLLFSAYYGIEHPEFRLKFNINSNTKLSLDSGGFQVASVNRKQVDPLAVLKWQEKNGDIGFIVDSPPQKREIGEVGKGVGIPIAATEDEFDNSLKTSFKNGKIAESNRTTSHLTLFNVLHGNTISRLNKWYNKMSAIMLDGWACGEKPADDPFIQALIVTYLKEQEPDIKSVHVFGVGGFDSMPILAYLAKKLDMTITTDSVTYAHEGITFKKYFNPIDYSRIFLGKEYYNGTLKQLPCFCRVCKVVKNFTEFTKEGSISGGLIGLHNLWQYLRYAKMLNSLKEDDTIFKEFTKRRCGKRMKVAMDFVDKAIDSGIDKAYKQENGENLLQWAH